MQQSIKLLPAAKLHAQAEEFVLRIPSSIARGTQYKAEVVTVSLSLGGTIGRGEGVPSERYGESVESVLATIASVAPLIEKNPDREYLQTLLPAGAARATIDCALWDLEAKYTGVPAFQRAGLPKPVPVTTAVTIFLDTPAEMGASADREKARPLLKVKFGGKQDEARLRAVRAAAPSATLIIDANESWETEDMPELLAICVEMGVRMIEQPLPVGADDALRGFEHPISIYADESVHDRKGLKDLRDRYDGVNLKLDKTGGLTEALEVAKEAKLLGFKVMVGCRACSSLAIAPSLLLAEYCEYVDLDGVLPLEKDRKDGLVYTGSIISPAAPALWG
jgi:L-alanine-DL-glutamate epimerase-like enolase superfamily enzyme